MVSKINYDKENDLIVVNPEGKFNSMDARQMMEQWKTLAKRSHSSGFIIDFSDAEVVTNSFKMFDFANEFNKHGISRSMKVAVVADRDIRTHRFFEVLARKKGFNVFTFYDVKTAKEWLKS